MRKTIFTPILFCLLSLLSMQSHADWLTDSLSVVANSGGVFKGQTGSTVSAGSIRVRVAHSRVQPISITPMSVSGGCNGIDVHLGGFSFISGEEILVMLKTIAQGVVSQAFYIAITQGCPICSKAIEISQRLSNWANQFSLDTCQASTEIANWGASRLADKRSGACSAKDSETNSTGSFLASMSSNNSPCNTKEGAVEILSQLKKACDPNDGTCKADNLSMAHLAGVSTYEYLVAMGSINPNSNIDMLYVNVYMSIIGTHINGIMVPAILGAEDIVNLIDCGVEKANDDSHTKEMIEYCDPWWKSLEIVDGASEKSIYRCFSGAGINSSQTSCAGLEPIPLKMFITDFNSAVLSETPFSLNGTSASLMRVINTVQGKVNQNSGVLTNNEIAMIGRAPFPLYRLLNLSSFYPGLVEGLIGDSIGWLSAEIALSQTNDFLNKLDTISAKIELNESTDTPSMVSEDILNLVKDGMETLSLQKSEYRAAREIQREAIDSITLKIASLERLLIQDNIQTLIGGASR